MHGSSWDIRHGHHGAYIDTVSKMVLVHHCLTVSMCVCVSECVSVSVCARVCVCVRVRHCHSLRDPGFVFNVWCAKGREFKDQVHSIGQKEASV